MDIGDKDNAITVAIDHIRQSNLHYVDKFLIICLLRNGLRVSDICKTNTWAILDTYTSIITSPKNNVTRLIQHAEAAEWADIIKASGVLVQYYRGRDYYYRQLKSLLPDYSALRSKTRAVTHAARYIKAQQVYDATGDLQAVADAIGDRTQQAAARYLSDDQRRLIIKRGVISRPTGSSGPIRVNKKGVITVADK